MDGAKGSEYTITEVLYWDGSGLSNLFYDDSAQSVVETMRPSSQTSYENQTKKAITNKFIQDAMSEFLRQQLQVFFIENHDDAERMAAQVLINKRSRETAERTRLGAKKKLSEKIDIANRVQKFVDCRTKEVDRREIYIVEGDSALGACKQSRDAEFQGLMPVRTFGSEVCNGSAENC